MLVHSAPQTSLHISKCGSSTLRTRGKKKAWLLYSHMKSQQFPPSEPILHLEPIIPTLPNLSSCHSSNSSWACLSSPKSSLSSIHAIRQNTTTNTITSYLWVDAQDPTVMSPMPSPRANAKRRALVLVNTSCTLPRPVLL